MIDFIKRKIVSYDSSLYLGLFFTIALGVVFALFAYGGTKQLAQKAIDEYYNTEEHREERKQAYFSSLQNYCYTNDISGEDTDKIAEWTDDNRYVYLLLYKDDEIFFSSDMSDDDSGEGENSSFMGGIVSFPNREDLITAAKKDDLYELVLTDGSLFASVAEFTDYLYLDLANLMALIVAVMVFGFFLIVYVSRIISRIKKLERDVAMVSAGETSHTINCYGRDEIATLSANVDNMRISIIDKLNKEREVKEANNELITSISHDLRTPLTVLIGYIDMMKNHEGCDGELKNYVIASENTAMRLKQLADDMFKYSLAFGDADKGIKLEKYDAETLVDQLFSEHMLLLSESGIDLQTKRVGRRFDGLMVYTDAPNLMRIVDNVFSNISKYADRSYPVYFTMERSGMTLVFECKNKIRSDASDVESNGIGLKTCTRLSKLIAEDFYYGEEDGCFVTRLSLKLYPEE